MRILRNGFRQMHSFLTSSARDQFIGLYIASLAVVLAVAIMGGSDASSEASRASLKEVNYWAWYQAKKGRKHLYELATLNLEIQLERQPRLSPDLHAKVAQKVSENRKYTEQLSSDGGEGLFELSKKAMEQMRIGEREREKSDYFDYATAFLQIAIVFASIALIISGNLSLVLSAIIAASGAVCMANGFLLVQPFYPVALLVLIGAPVLLLAGRENLTFGTLIRKDRAKLVRRLVHRDGRSNGGMRKPPAEPAE